MTQLNEPSLELNVYGVEYNIPPAEIARFMLEYDTWLTAEKPRQIFKFEDNGDHYTIRLDAISATIFTPKPNSAEPKLIVKTVSGDEWNGVDTTANR